MALRFLVPITAPTPLRPAARPHSFMILAKSTCLSPAGPMQATLASSSVVDRMASVVSGTVFPHRSAASRISTTSSQIHRYTGFADLPSRMIMSYPAYFSMGPKMPPELEAAMVPLSGPLLTTSKWLADGAFVPESGPAAKMSLFF